MRAIANAFWTVSYWAAVAALAVIGWACICVVMVVMYKFTRLAMQLI